MANTKQAGKDSFLLFHEVRLFFEELTAEEQGRLFMALLDYSEYGKEPEFTGMLRMAFRAIQRTMDRNTEKWEQTCAKRSEAGKKSAAAKAAKNFAETVSCKIENQETDRSKTQQTATNSTEYEPERDPEHEPEREPEREPDNIADGKVPSLHGEYADASVPSLHGEYADGSVPSLQRDGIEREGDFDCFWRAYPKKMGKAAAKRSFRQVRIPLDRLLQALERQKRSPQWTRDQGRFIPNPATWLNQARWEDELPGDCSGSVASFPGVLTV